MVLKLVEQLKQPYQNSTSLFILYSVRWRKE